MLWQKWCWWSYYLILWWHHVFYFTFFKIQQHHALSEFKIKITLKIMCLTRLINWKLYQCCSSFKIIITRDDRFQKLCVLTNMTWVRDWEFICNSWFIFMLSLNCSWMLNCKWSETLLASKCELFFSCKDEQNDL